MVGGIAQYLTEFRLDGSVEVEPLIQPKPPKPVVEKPVDDTADRIRRAEQRGRDEGRASAQQEFELALVEERSRHEEQLAAARAGWAEQQGAQLADQMGAGLRDIERRIADRVAHIMLPLLTQALREQMMTRLGEAFASLLSDRENAALRVSGPPDILAALSKHLDGTGPSVEFVPSDVIDVTICVGDTRIETQLEAWIGHLAQAVKPS